MKPDNTKEENFFRGLIEEGSDLLQGAQIDFEALEKKHFIDPRVIPPEPPDCIWINGKPVAAYGSFSVVSGQAKSRKSLFLSLIASAFITGKQGPLEAKPMEDKQNVLLFDTEQPRHRVYHGDKRIRDLTGIGDSDILKSFDIRTLHPIERLEFIKQGISKYAKGLGLVIIDGARDITSSINDEDQATEIVHEMLKMTGEFGIHISLVLHHNKANNHLRGHLGTELQNKAEMVFSVEKDKLSPESRSIVEYKFTRDMEPEPIALGYTPDGLPCIIDDWKPNTSSPTKKPRPYDYDTDKHFEVIRDIFRNQPEFTRGEILSQIKNVWGEYGNSFGDTLAKEYLTFYWNQGWFEKNGKSPKRVVYKMGDLNPGDTLGDVEMKDTPF